MNDNPFASPQTAPRPRHRERNLLWHALFNPIHPVGFGLPLALLLLLIGTGLIMFLTR